MLERLPSGPFYQFKFLSWSLYLRFVIFGDMTRDEFVAWFSEGAAEALITLSLGSERLAGAVLLVALGVCALRAYSRLRPDPVSS